MELNGIIILDKPGGISSSRAVLSVKHALGARKAGHLGTLDPWATGVLPICIGNATKIAPWLMDATKEYWAAMKLGEATDTQDFTGKVIEKGDPERVEKEDILEAFRRFSGEILQQPPIYSAIKRDGVPLYRRARRGETPEVSPRRITIHALDLLGFSSPIIFFRARTSAGTYIRTLAHDIGKELGCHAHLVGLRRVKSGDFSIDKAIPLKALKNGGRIGRDTLIPIQKALSGWIEINVDGELLKGIRNGKQITAANLRAGRMEEEMPSRKGEHALLVDPQGETMALAESTIDAKEICSVPEKHIALKLLRVFPC